MSFSAAVAHCKSLGASLVSIETHEEQKYLENHLTKHQGQTTFSPLLQLSS
jgi:hypothetical protein